MSNIAQEAIHDLINNPDFRAGIGGIVTPLMKAGTADTFSTGVNGQQLVWYDLEPTVKFLYPYGPSYTPLILGDPSRGIPALPRVQAKGGTATHWKTITKINSGNVTGGVERGKRGGTIAVDSNDMNAPFVGMGLEANCDFETRYENGELDPENIAIAVQSALRSTIIYEEKALVFGNASVALSSGALTAPTVLDGASSGGTLTAGGGTLSVYYLALTGEGYSLALGTGGTGVIQTVSRTNADGSNTVVNGGTSRLSSVGTLSLTTNHTAIVTWPAVSGAVAYAVYWSTSGAVATFGAIVTVNSIELKADPTGTQLFSALVATDYSKNTLIPDGIISQMAGQTFGAASNSYIKTMATGSGQGTTSGKVGVGTGLTTDSNGGIVEFDAAFEDRYNNYRLGFDRILCHPDQAIDINIHALNGSSSAMTSLFRFNYEPADKGFVAGRRVIAYHNKFTGVDLDIVVHPFIPTGTIIFWSDRVPYTMSNVANILQAKVRQGYYQIEWPLTTRQYQFGVYVDETFENYFTPAFGMITNLGHI